MSTNSNFPTPFEVFTADEIHGIAASDDSTLPICVYAIENSIEHYYNCESIYSKKGIMILIKAVEIVLDVQTTEVCANNN